MRHLHLKAAAGLVTGALVLFAGARGAGVVAAQGVSDADRTLVRTCSEALVQKTFDEATAAGLNPGAIPVSIHVDKVSLHTEGTTRVVEGVEEYRPSIHTDAMPVKYQCRIDVATGKVQAVTYAALDLSGAPIALPATQVVKDTIALDSCRDRIESRMDDEVRRRGDGAPKSELRVALSDTQVTRSAGLVDVKGTGHGRYGPAYDWQTATFTCRYDEKKSEATRSSHSLGAVLERQTLAPEARVALGACRGDIERQVRDAAVTRGYPSWELRRFRIQYPALAAVAEKGAAYSVSGAAQYKLDERHNQPTQIAYDCTVDAAQARIISATYAITDRGRTPSGAISSGPTDTLRCEAYSAQMRCDAPIKNDVRILRQWGTTDCVERTNWIWSPSGITVWNGCRAEFEFTIRR